MLTSLHRYLCVLMGILSFNLVPFAQDIPDPQDPKKQPLDKPTQTKETPKKQDPAVLEQRPTTTAAMAGGISAGKNPSSTQDGIFNNRFKDIPVNLYTGTPIIGFPIYTLSESGGASLPINLSYNASGMKGHDVSSWTGMNWTANSLTPQISRVVRGIPDEGKVIYEDNNYYYGSAHKGYYQWGLHADNDDENDSQADLFFLNINGTSYKFSFDANHKAHFYPEADIEVKVTYTPYTAYVSPRILDAGISRIGLLPCQRVQNIFLMVMPEKVVLSWKRILPKPLVIMILKPTNQMKN